ncbi:MAG: hypothetical protein HGB32_04735 [Geobacteraceae bacterium]|nr:hypothetical protein [Geobacteraceae bacterium]NTW79435.1 hypothetical protein [Geobacteraceae bacterium]
MNIVHFSVTPLAGSPIRIVNAINAHTDMHAELIVLDPDAYGARTFEGGYGWNQDRNKCLEIIKSADILHLHHYFSLDSSDNPFDFNFSATNTPIIRQFHSHPLTIAHGNKPLAESIINDKTPSLVIAQYPERSFPFSRIVPNIVPIHDPGYTPCEDSTGSHKIAFSPSFKSSAWDKQNYSRFDTKGTPETIRLLKRIQLRNRHTQLEIIMDKPHIECLRLKRESTLAIDDLITGSYHLSSLEALSMGKPTLCYIDGRTEDIIKEITGCDEIPWVNTRIEEAEYVLNELISVPGLSQTLGRESRRWMERYWNDAILIKYFETAYFDLLDAPDKFTKARFDKDDTHARWLIEGQFEVKWKARKAQANSWKLSTLWSHFFKTCEF